jgi:glycosyltransferase involved in cell wall biosynthesis
MKKKMASNIISVLMSVYAEKEEWLRKAIDSILAQTYTNFEFIIILDKPENDLLWGVLKEYERLDNRIVLSKNEQNIGLAATLNKGIGMSKGDYIVRMDADDISVPQRIKFLVEFMENNQEIGVCSSRIKCFEGSFLQNRVVKYPTKHEDLEITSLYKTPIAHAPCIIRRKVIDKFSPLYNTKCCRSQDYELWSRLMRNGILFATIPKALYLRKASNGIGPQPIPYQVIHNQVARNNIQQILKIYSLVVPDKIVKSDVKELSGVLRNYSGDKKRLKQLAVILFMYYISLESSAANRIGLFISSGDLFRSFFYIPLKMLWRIVLPNKESNFSVNNICTDASMSIF